jgi:hypothetical protein
MERGMSGGQNGVVTSWGLICEPLMVPPFDIFKRQGGGSVRWLGVVTDLEAAKLRVKELTESAPGEYFIFSLATGRRLNIKLDNGDASSEAKQKIPASESQEGTDAQPRSSLQPVQ